MPVSRPTMFYTDLITSAASDYLEWYHALVIGSPLTVRTGDASGLPFDTPCSALAQIRFDLNGQGQPISPDRESVPRAIAMSFYGGDTSVCANGYDTTDPEYLAKCVDTFNKIDAAATYMDVPVYWISPPQHPPAAPNPLIGDSLNAIAIGLGWVTVNAGEAVGTPVGYWLYDWLDSMPCLPGEDLADGCVAGMMDIRGVDGNTFSVAANGYSGGARRWAEAAVAGMLAYDPTPCESNAEWLVGCLPYYEGPGVGDKVAIIGDSIVNYADTEIRSSFSDVDLTMRGIPGCDLADGLRRLVPGAIFADPDYLFIELGINTALFDWDAGDVDVLEDILDTVAGVPNVIWVTLTCAEPNWYDQYGTGTLHDRIEDFKAALAAAVPSYPNVTIADFGVEQDLNPGWWTDGVHMTDAGNLALAAFMRSQIP